MFHDYRREIPDPARSSRPSKLDHGFNKAVNKWLTDIGSPDRLFTVNLPIAGEGPYGGTRVGLLLLKKGQAESITTEPYLLSRESFDSQLSRKNLQRMITNLSGKGFFSHLSKPEMDSALDLLGTADIGSVADVLAQFPKTFVVFDWESGNLENPYQELTVEFGQISRGKFNPTRIVDEFEKGFKGQKSVKFFFVFDGKKYESALPFNGDWLDPHFMEMIRQALRDKDVDGDYASISAIVTPNVINCNRYFLTVLRAMPVVLLINFVPLPEAYSLNNCLILYISIGLLDINSSDCFARTSVFYPTKTIDYLPHSAGGQFEPAEGGQFAWVFPPIQ